MKCPVCKTPDLLIAERRTIEIDYCPTCRGVWLDRGELDKLIALDAREAGMPAPSSARGYEDRERERSRVASHEGHPCRRDEHRAGHQQGYRKKRSLFDMFDFD
ncbi:zf-TFIIB domain-containing protein [Burkholderia gladioli]|uniref:TFIIB-type zinc ribbon-containing protein n=1 Tax=Burkholderia gladioli TaxID=28095 RepID=UPI0016403F97|nr:zf-TFIIB domain-containing protein [Burkholderia gladioli]